MLAVWTGCFKLPGGINLGLYRTLSHFSVQHFIHLSYWRFYEGKQAYCNSSSLRGFQQWGEFSRAMILTDSPTIPLVFKISTISLHSLCEGGKKKKERNPTLFFSVLRQQLDVYSLSLRGREASLLYCKPAQKSRPKPIEEMPFICPSNSQLHLMSFPPLLAGAYISSILMARGGRHRGT